jgi:hypothetical protein
MSAKHTPNWRKGKRTAYFQHIDGDNWEGFGRVVVRMQGANRDYAEGLANLALILAAPRLLALAKRYASECAQCSGTGKAPWFVDDSGIPSSTVGCDACADIRLVVEKAEGGE